MSSPKGKDSASVDGTRPALAAAFVKALGGPTGDVVQDVTCSFQRQLGRLYVSTDGIFFYSNLFGFERRIRIDYDQVLVITKIRTTSLLVKTVDGEEYIFRSFDNRELLLELILRYHPNAEAENGSAISTLHDEVKRQACDKSLDETDNDTSMGVIPSILDTGNNVPNVRDKMAHICEEEKDHVMDVRLPVGGGLTENNVDNQWAKLLQHTNQWESAIVNLNLDCKSVQNFFDLFLRDDAANSLNVFLSDVIGDSNIVKNSWQNDIATGETKSISRTVEYEHKSGLIMAKLTRQQTYQSYCNNRSCLKNVTSVKGIKGLPSDAFFLEDTWFIETSAEKGVILNVKFHVNFTKPTMMRSIIKKRASTEAREWYMQYTSFMRQKMHQSGTRDDVVFPPSSATTNAKSVQILLSFFGRRFLPEVYSYLPVLLIASLAFIVYQLQLRITILENSVKELDTRLYELKKSQFVQP